MTVATYSFTLDTDLLKRFEELAGPDEDDGAELLRSFIAHYVETRDADAAYDSWFIAKVKRGLESANAGRLIGNDDVEAEFAKRRAELLARTVNQ
jgi:predicted transcriptional regulator